MSSAVANKLSLESLNVISAFDVNNWRNSNVSFSFWEATVIMILSSPDAVIPTLLTPEMSKRLATTSKAESLADCLSSAEPYSAPSASTTC